jgi:molybdate transport system substrate-binding protein
VFLILPCIAMLGAGRPALAKDVLVFAAASTTPALHRLARLHESAGGPRVRLSFGASSTLARQIAFGAPADIFISANRAWMEYLVERKSVAPGAPVTLFANRLVLVVSGRSAAESQPITVRPDFSRLLGQGRLAIADPAHVPAGIYARAALRNLGLWPDVKDRLAPMMDVRAALALVERGEAAAGMVYGSDAHGNDNVRTLFEFPPGSHPPIAYPAALIAGRRNPAAEAFLDFLKSARARSLFAQFGFTAG